MINGRKSHSIEAVQTHRTPATFYKFVRANLWQPKKMLTNENHPGRLVLPWDRWFAEVGEGGPEKAGASQIFQAKNSRGPQKKSRKVGACGTNYHCWLAPSPWLG